MPTIINLAKGQVTIMTTYRIPDGGEYPEYTKFARYMAVTADVTYVPLLIGENRVRFYAQSTLVKVKSPFDSGMVYTCAEPPTYYTVPENIYPQAVFLALANGILEQSKRKLEIRLAIATSEIARAA